MTKVLVVDDELILRTALKSALSSQGYEVKVCESGKKALQMLQSEFFDIALVDVRLPDINGLDLLQEIRKISPETGVIIITAYAEVRSAVKAIKEGAFDYLSKPFQEEELFITMEKFLRFRNLERELKSLKETLTAKASSEDLVAESKAMREILQKVDLIAETDVPVLILGESGTGKEVIADLIQKRSKRRDKPYIKLNCTAIPETLFEAELFGYEKGAFTGASETRKGKLELANTGTLLLDEIGDLPLGIQAKLLRVLETNTFYPLGSKRELKVDVRYIFATSKDLKKLVEEGKFRDDLFYRINVIPIKIPPLRERKEDLPPLIRFFLHRFAEKYQRDVPKITKEAYVALLNYNYPGNVRELKHILERALLLSQDNEISLEDLPEEVASASSSTQGELCFKKYRDLIEREIIFRTLQECQGNKSETAKRLGISRKTLWKKLKEFSIQ